MKGTAFVFIIPVLALLLVGWLAPIASSSKESATPSKTESLQNRISPPHQLLLADRIDTEDHISYGTDPGMERTMAERAREEKEQKAWIMLQHMNLNNDNGRSHKYTQPGSTKPASTQPGNAP